MGEDASEVDEAPRAGGDLRHELVAERAETKCFDERLDAFVDRRLRVADRGQVEGRGKWVAHLDVALERYADRVHDRHRREQLRVLKRPTEPQPGACVRRQAGDVQPVQQHATGIRRDEAGDEIEQRRFAGTVRPQ